MAHVLIADPAPDIAQLVAAALERRGYGTEIRVGGEQPVSAPDVLVVDAGLRDATSLVDELRRELPGLPVVATGIHDIVGEPPLGARIYLVKPFAIADLTAAVDGVVPTEFIPKRIPASYA